MRFPLAAALLLLTSAALSGCVGEDEPPQGGPGGTPSASGTSATPPTTGSGSGGGGSGGGGTGGTGGTPSGTPAPGGATEPAGPPPEPNATTETGNIVFKAWPALGPVVRAPTNSNDEFRVDYTEGISGYIVVLEWSASTLLTQTMHIRATKAGSGGNAFHAVGESPLILLMPTEESSGGSYLVEFLAEAQPRVAVNQGLTYTVAVFDKIPFNAEWTPAA